MAACSDEPGWDVRNPLFGFEDVAIKDAFMVRHDGRWHFGYSHISDDPFRFRLGFSTSSDLKTFEPAPTLDQPETGGLASPDVVRAPDGRFVMVYNSHTRDVEGVDSKLYYRTSSDLTTWSPPARVHVDGLDAATDRLIDGAIAFTDVGVFLVFKREQRANVAYAASGSLDGPWTLLGDLEPLNLENYQLLRIDGRWHLLGTTIPLIHRPVLHRLDGDERDPMAWRTWTVVGELEIEEQAWNTGGVIGYERANAGYLVDDRDVDGYFYLLYAGSLETETFEGRGHSSLGLARSRDLAAWEVAPLR